MDKNKRAMLCMPGYGGVAASAMFGALKATRTPENVEYGYREGSLLAATFNGLWCDGLNYKYVDGKQLDYWAMQHSDIGPEEYWLDTLIEEMERNNLDVIGVAAPIKDSRNLTSIALERSDGDPWRPLCRLTLPEIYRLPETFTAEDVGHPLLLNTGLWVVRFDDWVKQGLHFTINDRIVYDTKLKYFIPKCEPEDWNFSRQLNRLGVRVGCTRKIRIVHRGPWEWDNITPFGSMSEFDDEWISHSVIPDDGFRFPYGVDGWLTFNEGRALYDACKGKRVLEIGSYCGLSTICIAQGAESVDSVDPHDGRGTFIPQNTLPKLQDNLMRFSVFEKIKIHVCTTDEYVVKPRFGEDDFAFDVIFIDGAHDYKSVANDILKCLPLLASDGVLLFHDYNSLKDPDVTKAIDEVIAAGGKLISTHDSLAVVKPPAAVLLEA